MSVTDTAHTAALGKEAWEGHWEKSSLIFSQSQLPRVRRVSASRNFNLTWVPAHKSNRCLKIILFSCILAQILPSQSSHFTPSQNYTTQSLRHSQKHSSTLVVILKDKWVLEVAHISEAEQSPSSDFPSSCRYLPPAALNASCEDGEGVPGRGTDDWRPGIRLLWQHLEPNRRDLKCC